MQRGEFSGFVVTILNLQKEINKDFLIEKID
jgi:hypothetical protein